MTADLFRPLPKVELHCHLDAGLRVTTVADLGREMGLHLPTDLAAHLVAPEVCADLADLLRRIDLALEVMQRPEHLTRIARELVEDLATENVIYAEVRFAPQLHTRRGLGLLRVLDAVHDGLTTAAREHGLVVNLMLCCPRHQTEAESLEVARLAVDNRHRVCALDLAADEGGHPDPRRHAPAFALAKRAGLHLTAHAGENAGPQSVRAALDLLRAERIGHGVRVEGDAPLLDRLAGEAISLDMCPTSNVQSRAVPGLAAHPIDRLLRRGLRVTVSTDGRTLAGTTLSQEFARLADAFGWGLAEFAACQRHAARAAFAPPEVKEELLARLSALPA